MALIKKKIKKKIIKEFKKILKKHGKEIALDIITALLANLAEVNEDKKGKKKKK